jgi:site-specific DNA-methyltransferase (adenine-specific)
MTTPEPRVSQLALGLAAEQPAALPSIGIAPEWKDQQRLWGHSFHPMCSYLASFPAALAHAFIARYSRRGDVVLDPFSGRGTTPLQASAEGRIGVGNDLNPFAHLLTASKVEPATRAEAMTRLAALRLAWAADSAEWSALAQRVGGESRDARPAGWQARPAEAGVEPVPREVVVAFHPRTLAQLLLVRTTLDLDRPTDRFLAAGLTGILHGKSASYLSEIMPNTFSMARATSATSRRGPPSSRRSATSSTASRRSSAACTARHAAAPGDRAARRCARRRARARAALRARGLPDRARLVVTSPPYLRVVKYGYYNWLRTWFLGFDAAEIDATLDDAHHREPYLAFVRTCCGTARRADRRRGRVLVVGDVEFDRGRPIRGAVGLAERVWETAAQPLGYRLAGVPSTTSRPIGR